MIVNSFSSYRPMDLAEDPDSIIILIEVNFNRFNSNENNCT